MRTRLVCCSVDLVTGIQNLWHMYWGVLKYLISHIVVVEEQNILMVCMSSLPFPSWYILHCICRQVFVHRGKMKQCSSHNHSVFDQYGCKLLLQKQYKTTDGWILFCIWMKYFYSFLAWTSRKTAPIPRFQTCDWSIIFVAFFTWEYQLISLLIEVVKQVFCSRYFSGSWTYTWKFVEMVSCGRCRIFPQVQSSFWRLAEYSVEHSWSWILSSTLRPSIKSGNTMPLHESFSLSVWINNWSSLHCVRHSGTALSEPDAE